MLLPCELNCSIIIARYGVTNSSGIKTVYGRGLVVYRKNIFEFRKRKRVKNASKKFQKKENFEKK